MSAAEAETELYVSTTGCTTYVAGERGTTVHIRYDNQEATR